MDIDDEEIKKACVLVLVYDATSQESKDRLSTHWLPRLEKFGITIVLVGNKIDK